MPLSHSSLTLIEHRVRRPRAERPLFQRVHQVGVAGIAIRRQTKHIKVPERQPACDVPLKRTTESMADNVCLIFSGAPPASAKPPRHKAGAAHGPITERSNTAVAVLSFFHPTPARLTLKNPLSSTFGGAAQPPTATPRRRRLGELSSSHFRYVALSSKIFSSLIGRGWALPSICWKKQLW